jgi:hypothetical protein
MSYVRHAIAVTLVLTGACSDDDPMTPDGPAEITMTGEIIDFDSTDADFKGVLGSVLTVRGETSFTQTTPPNGRINLTIPNREVIVDVGPGMDANGNAYIGGLIVVDPALATENVYKLRTYTTMRAQDFAYDPTLAQVYVHIEGATGPVAIAAAHDAAQSFDGTTWAAGDTGSNVFLPNVVIGGGTTTITVTGATGLPASIPLEAGKFTFVVASN